MRFIPLSRFVWRMCRHDADAAGDRVSEVSGGLVGEGSGAQSTLGPLPRTGRTERVGFEPTSRTSPEPVFETGQNPPQEARKADPRIVLRPACAATPEIRELLAAWPDLAEPVRAAILHLARAKAARR